MKTNLKKFFANLGVLCALALTASAQFNTAVMTDSGGNLVSGFTVSGTKVIALESAGNLTVSGTASDRVFVTAIPADKTAFVELNGSDATARVGDRARPFATFQAAYNAVNPLAANGQYMIVIGSGSFGLTLEANWNNNVKIEGTQFTKLYIQASGSSAAAAGQAGQNGFSVTLTPSTPLQYVSVTANGGNGWAGSGTPSYTGATKGGAGGNVTLANFNQVTISANGGVNYLSQTYNDGIGGGLFAVTNCANIYISANGSNSPNGTAGPGAGGTLTNVSGGVVVNASVGNGVRQIAYYYGAPTITIQKSNIGTLAVTANGGFCLSTGHNAANITITDTFIQEVQYIDITGPRGHNDYSSSIGHGGHIRMTNVTVERGAPDYYLERGNLYSRSYTIANYHTYGANGVSINSSDVILNNVKVNNYRLRFIVGHQAGAKQRVATGKLAFGRLEATDCSGIDFVFATTDELTVSGTYGTYTINPKAWANAVITLTRSKNIAVDYEHGYVGRQHNEGYKWLPATAFSTTWASAANSSWTQADCPTVRLDDSELSQSLNCVTASAFGSVSVSASNIVINETYYDWNVQNEYPDAPPLTVSGTISGLNFALSAVGYNTGQMPLNVLARRSKVTLKTDSITATRYYFEDGNSSCYAAWSGNFSGDGYSVSYDYTDGIYFYEIPKTGDSFGISLYAYGDYYGENGSVYWNYYGSRTGTWQVSGAPAVPAPAASSGRAFINAFDSAVWSNLANSTQNMYDKTGAATVIPSGTLVGTGTLFNW